MFESRKRHHLLLLPVLCGAGPVLAQDNPPSEIVVTGAGLPASEAGAAYSVRDFDAARMAASASGRIEDVLAGAAGVQQFRRSDSRSANPSAQGLTLRGLGGNASSRTLVLLDAVPLADPFFGFVPFSALPAERLAHLRVTRGGGSGPFGAGAVAGTVELDSADARSLGLVRWAALINDRGESELSASLAPELGGGFAVLSGRWDRGRGFWTTPESQRVPASVRAKFESWSASLRAVAPLAPEVEIQARALVYDDARTLRFAGADSTSSGQDASLRVVGRGAWQFDVIGYVQIRNFSNVVISSATFRKTLDQFKTPATGLGGKFELRPPLGGDTALRLGIDWRRASGTMREAAFNAGTGALTARRTAGGVNADLGLFAELDRRFGPLRLTGSVRADRWSVSAGRFTESNAAGLVTSNLAFAPRAGWTASLRGGALFDPGGGWELRAAAYSGLRQPTLNELYRPFVVFPVTTRANAALENERLRGFEGGVRFRPSANLDVSLSTFDNRIKGAIANVTIGPNLRERRNVDAVAAQGIEAEAGLTFGKLRLEASAAWTRARVRGSGVAAGLEGKRPAQVPAFAASGTLSWQPSEGWLVAATLRHTARQFEDDLNIDVLPAATTLDGVANVPLGEHLTLVLRAENVTDTQVVTRNQAGSIDLGAPRTVWVGLRISLGRGSD